MKVGIKGGFSVPVGETWIKVDIDIELDDKEIKNPKLYNVSGTIEKGLKLINGELEKHLDKQMDAIKKMAGDL